MLKKLVALAGIVAVMAIFACSDDDEPGGRQDSGGGNADSGSNVDSGAGSDGGGNTMINVDEGIAGTQVDRAGRPGISTVLLAKEVATLSGADLPTEADKDTFNQSTPQALKTGAVATKMKGVLAVLFSLGAAQSEVLPQATLEAVLIDGGDVLVIDTAGTTTGYLGVETAATNSFGGRGLTEDVVDTSLAALTRGALDSDGVSASAEAPISDFPYLAPENSVSGS